MSPEVHPFLDMHACVHHKWGGSGDIQETEKGNCLLNISWQNNLIAKHHRILIQSNLLKAPVLKTSSLQWIPPPTRSRGVAAPVVKIIHHDSVTKSYHDINHIFGKTCVGFPQTMWMWFWLLMRTVNNILVTVVSLCEIGPRCNHDVPQLRVLEGILFWKKAGGKKRHSTSWGRGPSSGLISTGSHR